MRKLKRTLLILAVIALAGVGGFFGWKYYSSTHAAAVKVYPFNYVGITEYWGDSQESYGPVSTDKIQTVYLSDTQTVSEIAVTQGQEVKQGDLLMSFDTTLSQLELERKEVEIQQHQLDIEEAEKELQRIGWLAPMGNPPTEPETEPTEPTDPTEPDMGRQLTTEYELFWNGSGRTQDTAFICWIPSGKVITQKFLQETIGELTEEEPEPTDPTESTDPTEPTDPTESTDPTGASEPTGATDPTSDTNPTEVTGQPETQPTAAPETQPVQTDPAPTAAPETQPASEEAATQAAENLTGRQGAIVFATLLSEFTPTEETVAPTAAPETQPTEATGPIDPTDASAPDDPTAPTDAEKKDDDEKECYPYYVIFKVTEGNYLKSDKIIWLGVHVYSDGSISFFDASNVEDFSVREEEKPTEPTDPTEETEPEETEPETDWYGSGYTYSELQKMKQEQQEKIKDLELKLKLAQAELKLMQKELTDGNVYAEQDGKVISVLTEEEAKLKTQPLIKVSSGGGYYVEASVGELARESLVIGQEVTVSDWNSGASYTGTIASIGDVPTNDGGSSYGNPNNTTYSFRVFVDESANLQAGNYVSVTYSAAEQSGLYMNKAFVRTDESSSYVYVRGESGLLEKHVVTVGRTLSGYYLEILDGLEEDDYIAFPYGKTVKVGAPTQEGDYTDMYA